MQDMKRTPKEMKAEASPQAYADFYPLKLYLTEDDLTKLGLSGMKVGVTYTLVAKCEVTEYGYNESGKKRHEHATLTIKQAEVQKPKRSDTEMAASIYKE